MRQHFEGLDPDFGLSTGDEPACEVVPLAIDSGAVPHVEDAFLAEFAGFARSRNHPPHAALELARGALDAIEDVDGAWQSLRIDAWLAGFAIDDAELTLLARAFLDWLVDRGRLSLHGQRVLARRIARFQRRPDSAYDLAPQLPACAA
jgi:hypothetical protein